jgi:hypothetical protein
MRSRQSQSGTWESSRYRGNPTIWAVRGFPRCVPSSSQQLIKHEVIKAYGEWKYISTYFSPWYWVEESDQLRALAAFPSGSHLRED